VYIITHLATFFDTPGRFTAVKRSENAKADTRASAQYLKILVELIGIEPTTS
jgi:hypothetical protein